MHIRALILLSLLTLIQLSPAQPATTGSKKGDVDSAVSLLNLFGEQPAEPIQLYRAIYQALATSPAATYQTVSENETVRKLCEERTVLHFGGPMLGRITEDGATVWIRTAKPARVEVKLTIDGKDQVLPCRMEIPQGIVGTVHPEVVTPVLHGHVSIHQHGMRSTLEDCPGLLHVSQPPAVLAGAEGDPGLAPACLWRRRNRCVSRYGYFSAIDKNAVGGLCPGRQPGDGDNSSEVRFEGAFYWSEDLFLPVNCQLHLNPGRFCRAYPHRCTVLSDLPEHGATKMVNIAFFAELFHGLVFGYGLVGGGGTGCQCLVDRAIELDGLCRLFPEETEQRNRAVRISLFAAFCRWLGGRRLYEGQEIEQDQGPYVHDVSCSFFTLSFPHRGIPILPLRLHMFQLHSSTDPGYLFIVHSDHALSKIVYLVLNTTAQLSRSGAPDVS